MPVKIYLCILPTENLDVPEMPFVSCVWIYRGTETWYGFDKGLDLFALLLSGSPWRLAALENKPRSSCVSPSAFPLLSRSLWSDTDVVQLSGILSPRLRYERLCERRWTSFEGTVPSWAHSVYWFDLCSPPTPKPSYFPPLLFLVSLFGCHLFCVSCHRTLSFVWTLHLHCVFRLCQSPTVPCLCDALPVSVTFIIYFIQKWKSKISSELFYLLTKDEP